MVFVAYVRSDKAASSKAKVPILFSLERNESEPLLAKMTKQ